MKISFIRLALLATSMAFFVFPSSAQQTAYSVQLFTSTSGEQLSAVTQNAAGNSIVAGSSYNGNISNLFVGEVSPSGSILQQNMFSAASSFMPLSIASAAGGYYMVSGYMFDTPSDNDWFLAKLDASLNMVWFKRLGVVSGNDYANSIQEVSPDHFVVTGTTALSGSAKPSLVMIDSSGTILHQGFLNTNQFASPNYRGRYLGNGEVAFVNLFNAVSILDTTGAVIKHGAFSTATFTRDVVSDGNGGYAVCGVAGFGSLQGSSISFAVLDSQLNAPATIWNYRVSGYDLRAVSMHRKSSGNFCITGYAMNIGSGNARPILLEVDAAGNVISSVSHLPGTLQSVYLLDAVLTPNDEIIFTGDNGMDSYIAKLDSAGTCFALPFPVVKTSFAPSGINPHSPFAGTIPVLQSPAIQMTASAATSSVLCVTTGVADVLPPLDFSVYPTLFTDYLNISVENADGEEFLVELADAQGRSMVVQQVSGQTQLNVSSLSAGVYFLRITDASGMHSEFARIVKADR